MKILQISITDIDLKKFGIKKNNLKFDELVGLITQQLQKQNFNKAVALANDYGLSEMSLDEINREIKAVRDAKNNS
jgi:hypothetical protein